MNIYDYILIGALVAAIHRAIGHMLKQKNRCGGDCSQCAAACRKSSTSKNGQSIPGEEVFHATDKR